MATAPKHLRFWIVAIALALASPEMAVQAADDAPAWQATLKLQLDDEKKCQLAAFVSVRELPAENVGGIEGRIRCLDGREFDFTRQKAHQKFDIRLCQPAVC